jgi:hypothetical protein
MMNAREKFQRAFELRQYVENMQVSDNQLYSALYENAARDAATQIEGLVGRCLVENWRAAGLGKTGTMERNLSHPRVFAKVDGKRIQLRMYMDPLSVGYNAKGGSRSAFVVAAALNYGAVRMPKETRPIVDIVTGASWGESRRAPIGRAAKATIKKIALAGSASKRATEALARGYRLKKSGKVLTEGMDLGHVEFARQTRMGTTVHFSSKTTVIPPKKFFYLTTRQNSVIGTQYLKLLVLNLKRGSSYAS